MTRYEYFFFSFLLFVSSHFDQNGIVSNLIAMEQWNGFTFIRSQCEFYSSLSSVSSISFFLFHSHFMEQKENKKRKKFFGNDSKFSAEHMFQVSAIGFIRWNHSSENKPIADAHIIEEKHIFFLLLFMEIVMIKYIFSFSVENRMRSVEWWYKCTFNWTMKSILHFMTILCYLHTNKQLIFRENEGNQKKIETFLPLDECLSL